MLHWRPQLPERLPERAQREDVLHGVCTSLLQAGGSNRRLLVHTALPSANLWWGLDPSWSSE